MKRKIELGDPAFVLRITVQFHGGEFDLLANEAKERVSCILDPIKRFTDFLGGGRSAIKLLEGDWVVSSRSIIRKNLWPTEGLPLICATLEIDEHNAMQAIALQKIASKEIDWEGFCGVELEIEGESPEYIEWRPEIQFYLRNKMLDHQIDEISKEEL